MYAQIRWHHLVIPRINCLYTLAYSLLLNVYEDRKISLTRKLWGHRKQVQASEHYVSSMYPYADLEPPSASAASC